jgi:hypothetical protein
MFPHLACGVLGGAEGSAIVMGLGGGTLRIDLQGSYVNAYKYITSVLQMCYESGT